MNRTTQTGWGLVIACWWVCAWLADIGLDMFFYMLAVLVVLIAVAKASDAA